MLLSANQKVVMVEHQPADTWHFVESFSGNFLDLVVGHVNHLKLVAVVHNAKDVPVQEWNIVAVKDQYLKIKKRCLVPRPGQSTWLEELMNGLLIY